MLDGGGAGAAPAGRRARGGRTATQASIRRLVATQPGVKLSVAKQVAREHNQAKLLKQAASRERSERCSKVVQVIAAGVALTVIIAGLAAVLYSAAQFQLVDTLSVAHSTVRGALFGGLLVGAGLLVAVLAQRRLSSAALFSMLVTVMIEVGGLVLVSTSSVVSADNRQVVSLALWVMDRDFADTLVLVTATAHAAAGVVVGLIALAVFIIGRHLAVREKQEADAFSAAMTLVAPEAGAAHGKVVLPPMEGSSRRLEQMQ